MSSTCNENELLAKRFSSRSNIYVGPDLFHRVSFTQRHRVRLFQRIEIDGDRERDGDFVRTGIPTTDRTSAVVNLMRNTSLSQQSG